MGKKEFNEKGATASLMVRITKLLWSTWKVVFMDRGCCVLEEFIPMVTKGVLGSALIKKRYYWHKGVPA